MPKDSDRRERTPEEIEQEQREKFKTFFTTSVVQVPDEMINHARQPDRKHGLLARFFAKKEKARGGPPPAEESEEIFWAETPVAATGEILLDGPALGGKPDDSLELEPPAEEIALELEEFPAGPSPRSQTAPAVQEKAKPVSVPAAKKETGFQPQTAAPAAQEKAKPVSAPAAKKETGFQPQTAAPAAQEKAKPVSAPAAKKETGFQSQTAAPAAQEKAKPVSAPAAKKETGFQPQTAAPAAQEKAKLVSDHEKAAPANRKQTHKQVRLPDEEDKEFAKLKVMLDTMGGQPPRESRPAAVKLVEDKEITQQVGGFHFFGIGEDEAPRGEPLPPLTEDTMSIELHEEEPEQDPASAPEPRVTARRRSKKARAKAVPGAHEAPDHGGAPQPEEAQKQEEPARTQPSAAEEARSDMPRTAEEAAQALTRTVASLNLRCALSGILAAALIWAGLIYEGVLPGMAGLNPAGAPAAFMGANLLLLAAALAVSRHVLRDGLLGLVKAPSYDTMPALAGAAALVQAVIALLNPAVYQSTTLTLMSGAAALALFLNHLGSRLLAVSVRDGHKIAVSGVEHFGAYRAQDRDLIRRLAPALEEKDPWILLSRPIQGDGGFLNQSFGPRAGEKRVQLLARVLLGCAVAGALWMLLTGKGPNGAAAAVASILCLGAPLSSTLIAGLTALRAERTAGAVGAVIPGWAGIEELNGIDTLQIDAGELFTPESAQLEDIRIFKGGRIDRAILYTASVLNQGCNTLSRLFRTVIADRTDILPPVKDLECRTGLGFAAWCDNNRILIGTRAFMEQEGVALPDASYEAQHSRDGELQVLYLAVSGNMYAMFVLRYVGGKHAARCLSVLQKENIRLLVTCQDPSLTADKIAAVYHLPEGLITVLDGEQCSALAPAVSPAEDAPCCMLHLKGFASLTGGLRAAQRAQTAELTGVAIQLVSAGFSALIGLLLSYSGSVGTLSMLVVLMYQAAWSGLSIAVAAMKQHS